MKLELKSYIFKNNQKLEEITLFTNIVIIKPVFDNSSAELINDSTLSRQCGLKYTNESHQTECTLSSKSFTSIKLNKNGNVFKKDSNGLTYPISYQLSLV